MSSPACRHLLTTSLPLTDTALDGPSTRLCPRRLQSGPTFCTSLLGTADLPNGSTVLTSSPYHRSHSNVIATNATFRDIVISLGATYGLYLVSSLLYFEPWHMFTSFIQYLLLLPSFVNILLIYSFCNLHDVSWGTKGSTTTGDLGAAKLTKKDGKDVMEVAVPTNKDDLSELWLQARGEIRNRPEVSPLCSPSHGGGATWQNLY